MSSDHFEWLSTGSTLNPISLTPRLSNSGFNFARAPSSVVQTGVKSFGCENKSAQFEPIQSWNLILPSVVWASKSGATAPIWSAMVQPHVVQVTGEFVVNIIGRSGVEGNRRSQKGEILLREGELLAPSCDLRPCDERTAGAVIARIA